MGHRGTSRGSPVAEVSGLSPGTAGLTQPTPEHDECTFPGWTLYVSWDESVEGTMRIIVRAELLDGTAAVCCVDTSHLGGSVPQTYAIASGGAAGAMRYTCEGVVIPTGEGRTVAGGRCWVEAHRNAMPLWRGIATSDLL